MAICFAAIADAQDVIVKKNNEAIACKIVEVTSSNVIYKKVAGNSNESPSVVSKSDISRIIYANGKVETLSEQSENQYAPGNQNTGVQMYNDRALVNLDNQNLYVFKKAKSLRTTGIVCGIILIGGGIGLIAAGSSHSSKSESSTGNVSSLCGLGLIVAGGVTWYYFNKKAKRIENEALYSFNTIISKEYNLGNGKSMAAGIDLINNKSNNNQSLGLGLRFNL